MDNSGETEACNKVIMCKIKVPKLMVYSLTSSIPAFAGFKMFALSSAIEMLIKDALNRYYSSDNDDPISATVKLFADVINIHPLEDGNVRLCQVMLSQVLMYKADVVCLPSS